MSKQTVSLLIIAIAIGSFGFGWLLKPTAEAEVLQIASGTFGMEQGEAKVSVSYQKAVNRERPKNELTIEDAVIGAKIAEGFLKEYCTFKNSDLSERLDRMTPYITKELHKEMAPSKIAYGAKESQFISVNDRFIQPLDDGMYWTGKATTKLDGKIDSTLFYITLVWEDGWKVTDFDMEMEEADDLD